jgi:hypothetical protein
MNSLVKHSPCKIYSYDESLFLDFVHTILLTREDLTIFTDEDQFVGMLSASNLDLDNLEDNPNYIPKKHSKKFLEEYKKIMRKISDYNPHLLFNRISPEVILQIWRMAMINLHFYYGENNNEKLNIHFQNRLELIENSKETETMTDGCYLKSMNSIKREKDMYENILNEEDISSFDNLFIKKIDENNIRIIIIEDEL